MSEIGETLRERRMALKIDVHEVEEATKIRAKYLRALENEEYDLLPGSAYVKSFLRTYADYLGLDSRALVAQLRASGRSVDDEPLVPTIGPESAGRSLPLPVLLVIGVLVLLVALYLLGAFGGNGGA